MSPQSDTPLESGAPGLWLRAHNRLRPHTWKLALANLIAQIGIVVTGGAVRLTGSGLGCSTWPQCEPGHFTPLFHEAATFHSAVEFGNRLMTFVLGIVALALIVAVWPVREYSHRVRWVPWWVLIGIGAQGIIGGITVLVDLHPAVVGFHMLISLALIALSAWFLLLWRTDGLSRKPVLPRGANLLAYAAGVAALALLVLGVLTTGSGPHSGDDEVGYRFALDPAAISRLHALAGWLFSACWVALMVWAHRVKAPRMLLQAMWFTAACTLFQVLIGYVQYFTGLPELLVGLHMLGAGLMTASLAWALSLLRLPSSVRGTQPLPVPLAHRSQG